MTRQWIGLAVAAGLLDAALCAAPAEQPAVPEPRALVSVYEGRLEVEAGQKWSTRVAVPSLPDHERPVLRLRAYALAGGGCNRVMQVFVNDAPLTESLLRRRLLNKLPWFDPPGTKYHFAWYDAALHKWMTLFGPGEPITWGGTGRDTEFLFDLTGLVTPGEAAKLGFRHAMPSLPRAIKKDRAPLVLCDVAIGALSAADVERLRGCVQASDSMTPGPVRPQLPAGATPGPRPYELVWSGRQESPRAQVAFDDLRGWTLSVRGDVEASLEASVEHRLWRRQLAKLGYSDGSKPSAFLLRPPKPVPIDGPIDAADLWLYGDIDRRQDRHPRVVAYLEDRAGRDFAIDLGRVRNSYWVRLHGVAGQQTTATAKLPLRFVGLSVETHPVKGQRGLYLASLAFYQRDRKPFAKHTRPERPLFPTSDDGMLPPAPAGARIEVESSQAGAVFTCKADGKTLRFRVEPDKGMLNGVAAQWDDGPWFQPMAAGELMVDLPADAPEQARVLSRRVADGRFVVRWQQGVQWQATYALRGRALVVDVACAGGAGEGLRLGEVTGLAGARSIEVPYLTYGTGYGPRVACGGGLFASVLVDWYHTACSRVDSVVPKPGRGGVPLMAGTFYQPLTNGRRNDLRDRVLVTVSPEFAGVLPTIPHPAAPTMERLSKYMFVMSGYMRPNLWRTLKAHGIDHVIACDFARFYVDQFPEGFAGRWRPHPSLTMKQIQDYRRGIKDLGYLFGAYSDLRDWFPLNGFWDDNGVSLTSEGDLTEGWYGNFRTKPNYLPVLARLVGEKAHEHYPPDSVYMDTHTCVGMAACDYEAGVPGAGIARDQVFYNAECILETRKWYGTVMSEGRARWMYAGIADMDYASLFSSEPPHEVPPLVDFDLLRIHPLNLGTMMGHSPSIFFRRDAARLGKLYRDQRGPAPTEFYQYVSASLAYGHMLMLGYSYLPPLARTIQLYALMQGLQGEYLTDIVTGIRYHNGREFVSTSRALFDDTQKLGRVWVQYSRGLSLHVNYNAEAAWTVSTHGGRGSYELPPFGWLAHKPGHILAFSAVVDGQRVDYVECPEYIYLRADSGPATVRGLRVHGAVWLKRQGKGWRLIPCGDLGLWERFAPEGLPAHMQDLRLGPPPSDRGCKLVVLDTQALLGKPAAAVTVKPDTGGKPAAAQVEAPARLRLILQPDVPAYLVQ